MRHTHTFAILEVSQSTFDDVTARIKKAHEYHPPDSNYYLDHKCDETGKPLIYLGEIALRAEDSCKCIDCGGTEPGHSSDCTFMNELHGLPARGVVVTSEKVAELLSEADEEDLAAATAGTSVSPCGKTRKILTEDDGGDL